MDTKFDCGYCSFQSSSNSGVIRHRNNRHLHEIIAFTVPDTSVSSDDDEFEQPGALEPAYYPAHQVDVNEVLFPSDAPIICTLPAPYRINTSYLDCQVQTLLTPQLFKDFADTGRRETGTAECQRTIHAFAEVVTTMNLSAEKMDILLGFLHRDDIDLCHLPKSSRTYEADLTKLLQVGEVQKNSSIADGEVKVEFDISNVNLLSPTVHIVKRANALTAVIKLLTDFQLCQPGSLHFSPVTLLTSQGERAYEASWTGDWWATMYKKFLRPGCLPLVVNLFTDGTLCGKTQSRTPMLASISNMPVAVQRAQCGKTLLGFVPVVTAHKVSSVRAANTRFAVKHKMYELIGKDLFSGDGDIIALMLHGQIVNLQVFVQNIVCDGVEQRAATGVLSACTRCSCVSDNFDRDFDQLQPEEKAPRTSLELITALRDCDKLLSERQHLADGTVGRIEERLQPLNVRHRKNALLSFPFASETGVFSASASDRMHLIAGLIGNLQLAFNKELESEATGNSVESYLNAKHKFLDGRFVLVPPFVTPEIYLPRFTKGFYTKSMFESWHLTAWLSLIPFLVGDDCAVIQNQTRR
jgi:hypothetical protein